MKEHEKIILEKIKTYAAQAVQFKGDMNFAEFSEDAKTIAACVLNLSQIGELAGRLSDEFLETNAQIPWRKIKVHLYIGAHYAAKMGRVLGERPSGWRRR